MDPKLIVMLTHNDLTVPNAQEIFNGCADTPADYWGFKEQGLPLEEMKALFSTMKEHGKTTFLEVVEYEEAESLAGAAIAVECGCDILMGTVYYPSVHKVCKDNNIKYMPFIGDVSQRPSILEGDAESMLQQINNYLEMGVDGVDLLGYRYTGDAEAMIRKVIDESPLPVCLAGSIDSFCRLDFVKEVKPWAFTIGSAFFDEKFGASISGQISDVVDYLNQ